MLSLSLHGHGHGGVGKGKLINEPQGTLIVEPLHQVRPGGHLADFAGGDQLAAPRAAAALWDRSIIDGQNKRAVPGKMAGLVTLVAAKAAESAGRAAKHCRRERFEVRRLFWRRGQLWALRAHPRRE